MSQIIINQSDSIKIKWINSCFLFSLFLAENEINTTVDIQKSKHQQVYESRKLKVSSLASVKFKLEMMLLKS